MYNYQVQQTKLPVHGQTQDQWPIHKHVIGIIKGAPSFIDVLKVRATTPQAGLTDTQGPGIASIHVATILPQSPI